MRVGRLQNAEALRFLFSTGRGLVFFVYYFMAVCIH